MRFTLPAVIAVFLMASGCKTRTYNTSSQTEWTSSGAEKRVEAPVKQAEAFPGTCTPDQKFCAYFAPTDMPIFAVAKELMSAKKSIRIATYNMDVRDYVDILNEKANRGIKVEFMQDYAHTANHSPVLWSGLRSGANLSKWRLPVMRGGNPQMHNKIILIDDEKLLIGSANYTYSGLVANYENVMKIQDPTLIKKFNAEVDELKSVATLACQTFASNPQSCGSGNDKWDADMHKLVTDGHFPKSAVTNPEDPECKGFVMSPDEDMVQVPLKPSTTSDNEKVIHDHVLDTTTEEQPKFLKLRNTGLLDSYNMANVAVIKKCFKNPKYAEFAQKVMDTEKFVDGTLVKSEAEPFKHKDQQEGDWKQKVFFSPEDGLQFQMNGVLKSALKNPGQSFLYASTNFITNKKFAATIAELHKAGVRMKIFFDRGRFDDPLFQNAIADLKPLGFMREGNSGIDSRVISVFDNQLTGPYGCNHNKFAVIGTPEGLTLINGSANWSGSAMSKNDEHVVILKNDEVAAIYLKEVLNQLYVYRYKQDPNSAGFKDDLNFLSSKVPCLKMLMGQEKSCKTTAGKTWEQPARSHAVLSLEGVPANGANESVWVWAPDQNGSGKHLGVRAFTHEVFGGRWLTSVPVQPNGSARFKFYKAGADFVPQADMSNAQVEFGGMGNDRTAKGAPWAVHVIEKRYNWGNPQ